MLRNGMYLGNRYEILERIGAGGMSDVYKAKDHKLNRYVAIKVLKREFNADRNFVQKFRAEAQSAAGLQHPNIVNVYDVGEEDELHYIVMELVEGITLKKYIEKKRRLEPKETIGITIQVAQGIEAAHSQHIVHRDIKPQNIIISREGKVKVTDFGIAKAASSQTISSNAMGSVHYISPEQARGGYCDERSDIYSLGITMYEMITGRVPYEGDSTVAVALLHIQGDMKKPSELVRNIPVSLEKIILKCTQKKPEYRYLTVSALIADLKRALVTPNEDFVQFKPIVSTSSTRVISNEEVRQIKAETNRRNASVKAAQEAYLRGEEDLGEDEEYEEYEREKYEDYDEYENYDEDEEVNTRFEKVILGIGIAVAAVILVLAIYAVGTVTGLFNRRPSGDITVTTEEDTNATQVAMPSVVGKNVVEAQTELDLVGLHARVVIKVDNTADVNEVVGQEYEPGTMIDVGSYVVLYVNSEDNTTAVPKGLKGLTITAARTAISGADLFVSTQYEYSDTIAKGIVIRVDPAEGTELTKWETVTVYVSKGSEADEKTVTVPSVVGYHIDDAKDILESYGLVVSPSESSSDTVQKNYVISQSDSGKTVQAGTTIYVVVSTGSANVVVPSVLGKTFEDAKSTLEAAGLYIGSNPTKVASDTYAEGLVVSQSVKSGDKVTMGTVITVSISTGPETSAEPTETETPATQAPVTDPVTEPVTEPPVTEPVTEPPVTDPVTEPPVTDPVTDPVTEPPVTDPVTEAPVTEAPVTEAPVDPAPVETPAAAQEAPAE